MQIYIWTSIALQGYANGQIIVVAHTVHKARRLVLEHAASEGRDAAFIEKLRADINPEPEVRDPGRGQAVVFVNGSA